MQRSSRLLTLFLSVLVGPLVLVGCASDPMPRVRADYAAGRYESVVERLQELVRSGGDDHHVYELELGMAATAAGRPELAVDVLRRARDRLDELHGTDLWESISAALTDDRALDYEGWDYEHVLVRAMLAVADLMSGAKDASAYAFQVLERQQKIIEAFEAEDGDNPKRFYKMVAFGSYVRAILNEERVRDRDVAEREFERVLELEPGFRYAQKDLARVRGGRALKPGYGVVHVIGLVGRGPFRVEGREMASQQVLELAKLIWSHNRRRPFVLNPVPVPIPMLAFHQDNPTKLAVSVDGRQAGVTATVTNVEEVARAEFEAMRNRLMVRALLRRMLKLVITEAAKETVYKGKKGKRGDGDRHLASIGIDLLGILWTASEQADLRCWSLLPASFQALRLELPEGEHEIEFRAANQGRVTGGAQRVRVRVDAGFHTYVTAIAPTLFGGPPPMTSAPAAAPGPKAETESKPTTQPVQETGT